MELNQYAQIRRLMEPRTWSLDMGVRIYAYKHMEPV